MCKYVTHTRFTFHMHDLELWALLYSLTDEGNDVQKAPRSSPGSQMKIKLVKKAGLNCRLILNHHVITEWLHNHEYFRVTYWVEDSALQHFIMLKDISH